MNVLGRCTQPLSDCSRPKVNILLPPLANRYAKCESTMMDVCVNCSLTTEELRVAVYLEVQNEVSDMYLLFLSRYGAPP